MSILNSLKGKRTYIITALMFIVGGCKAVGFIDNNAYEAFMAFLLPLSVASLRASK